MSTVHHIFTLCIFSIFEVGIDVGILDFATLSDGTKIENPKWFHKVEEKLAKAQRILSRRKHGSSNWYKQKKKAVKFMKRLQINEMIFCTRCRLPL